MKGSSSTSRLGFGLLAIVCALAITLWIGCDEVSKTPSGPETTQGTIVLSEANPQIQAVMAIQDRHTAHLMANPDVVGTATGLTEDGKLAIVVFTKSEINSSSEEDDKKSGSANEIPTHVEGVPVVVRVTGEFIALQRPPRVGVRLPAQPRAGGTDTTQRFPRPVPIGVSTGHPEITAGTIGCRVKDANGDVYALSNNHVYANKNDASIGDSALQPGPFDGGTDPNDRIGGLSDFELIVFNDDTAENQMDAAIAVADFKDFDGDGDNEFGVGASTPSDGYGTPNSKIASAALNQPVQKYGRTTKLTKATVSEINVTVDVCYDGRGRVCFQWARFVNQIAIESGDFSDGGDSGSLIVTDDANKNPVGLLFAGSSTRTIANRIDLVLQRFGVSVDDTQPAPKTDVAVTDVTAPSSVVQGDAVSVDITVKNVGNQDVSSDINVTLTDDTDNVTIGTQTISGGLAAGASTALTYSWDASGASLGDHTLRGAHDFADDDASNDANTTTVTVNEDTGSDITLTATGYKVKGLQKADLESSGATSTNVDIYRDGVKIATTENDGFYTDNIDERGGGSYTYKVCEEGTSTCSNEATVTF